MLRIPLALPGEIGVSFLRALSTRILCSGKVHSKSVGWDFGVSKETPPLSELNKNCVGNLFCVTDVGQVYLPWLPVGASVHLCGVADGLEMPALAIKDRFSCRWN